ncbi:hypothetical protein, partial [Klebsiella pneumoniae]|uniref:hypothetical protein n=1 Tax=Klebsiella pneumoniae TaxID=573 RepID=UPI003012AB1D
RSLSQEIEHLLRAALDFPERMQREWRADHHYGLGRLVARVAWSVEFSTGLYTPNEDQSATWLTDPFTAAAVRAAIDTLLRGL